MIDSKNVRNETQEKSDEECAEFQALMSERIGAGEDLQSYEHMKTCERCLALLRDLESMAKALKDLWGADVDPAKDLWPDIEGQLNLEKSEGKSPSVP